jgi:hypothetical protein
MRTSITVAGHEVKAVQGEYEDFDGEGNPVIRATGHSTWRCSCGQDGAGANEDVGQEIRAHLGVDENGEVRDRGR